MFRNTHSPKGLATALVFYAVIWIVLGIAGFKFFSWLFEF